jgi:hypothetical protein
MKESIRRAEAIYYAACKTFGAASRIAVRAAEQLKQIKRSVKR